MTLMQCLVGGKLFSRKKMRNLSIPDISLIYFIKSTFPVTRHAIRVIQRTHSGPNLIVILEVDDGILLNSVLISFCMATMVPSFLPLLCCSLECSRICLT